MIVRDVPVTTEPISSTTPPDIAKALSREYCEPPCKRSVPLDISLTLAKITCALSVALIEIAVPLVIVPVSKDFGLLFSPVKSTYSLGLRRDEPTKKTRIAVYYLINLHIFDYEIKQSHISHQMHKSHLINEDMSLR